MIIIENVEVTGFKAAIRGMRGVGYRKRKSGYETYITTKRHLISLGTYKTESEAEEALYNYRLKKFIDSIQAYGLDEKNCMIIHEKYAVFKSGEIFNLYGKKMVGMIDRCGYREVLMNGKQYRVHRIVAESFIPNPFNKPCVNHIDGNKLNNDISNLEWVTYSENTSHAYQIGLEKKVYGEKHHAHKLTENNVKEIRNLYKKRDKEYGAVPLAKKYGVDRTTILDVVNMKTWRFLND